MKPKKFKQNKINVVYNKDARTILKTISADTRIKSTITSPPYFDMKDYDSENQVGYGQTYENYLNDLKSIFDSVFQITEEDGSLWIIIDTFKRNNQVVTLPFDLSSKLKEVGWLLQDVIIWKKDKTVPWSSNGFMQRKFEYILFFSKSTDYKSNKDKVRVHDTNQLKKWWIKYPERYNPRGKALDEVWEFPIPIQGSWGDEYIRHFCPLPRDMVATMIQISTDEDDIILDPFAGSGTVLSQSLYMKRNYIGFETNRNYITMFKTYLKKTFEINRAEYELLNKNSSQDQFEKTILQLRALKYARIILANIRKKIDFKYKIVVGIKSNSNLKNKLIVVEYELIGEIDNPLLPEIIISSINKQPLSKYGIEPIFKFSNQKNIDVKKYYCYTQTNTYSYVKEPNLSLNKVQIFSKICVDINPNDYL